MAPRKKQTVTQESGPQELVLHLKAPAKLPDGTLVLPGANRVEPSVIAMVRADRLMQQWLAVGHLTIRENVPEPGSIKYDRALGMPRSLLGLDLETIRWAVAACGSRDQVIGWLDSAGIPEVRQLLIDRAYEIAQEQAATTAAPEGLH